MSSIRLDQNGDIISHSFEKTLTAALQEDVQYKLRDNMKKRACKVAGSYDEFKAMVDCAHLKKVSRQDIESLRAVKRGWKGAGSSSSTNKATTGILSLEEENKAKLSQAKNIEQKLQCNGGGGTNPRTPLELGRDMKRLKTNEDKLRYMQRIGVDWIVHLLQIDADAELFEMFLQIVVFSHERSKSSLSDQDISLDTYDWMIKMGQLKKFTLLIGFLDKSIKQQIAAIVEGFQEISEEDKITLSQYAG